MTVGINGPQMSVSPENQVLTPSWELAEGIGCKYCGPYLTLNTYLISLSPSLSDR